MQIHIQGTLIDPTGKYLPNHNIKITSRSNDSLSFVESNTIETTNDLGEYSFILTEGWKYIEVLFNNTYILTGDVLVNDSTPSPINLTELIEYSTPVEPSGIYTLPNEWDTLQNTLEQGSFTHYRENRDQVVDTLTHIVKLGKVYVSEDELERSAEETNEVSSCDAKVVEDALTYSDDVGNSYVQSSNEVSNKNGSDRSRTLIGSELIKNTDTSLGEFTESNLHNITTIGSSKTFNTAFNNLNTSTTEVISDGEYSYTNDITSLVGTVGSTKEVDSNKYTNKITLGDLYKDEVSVSNSLNTKTYLSKIGTKELVEEYFNDGTNRTKTITLDKFKVGREGNTLFEVDNYLNRVTVRGSLRITDIEDQDGNPIDLPKDGDTIFQVFRYGETSNGPWEAVLQSYHLWKQENTSVNGYIDPTGWSGAYKFRGEDGVGNPGDTIYIEYNYSPDGLISWTPELKAGDEFRRERTITNGVAGAWSDPARIKGTDGDEIEIRSQYSVDGVSNWHDNLVDGDIYERRARFVNGVIDSPWSDPFRIVGEKGDEGIPGLNGSGWYSIVNGTGTWPGDTQATTDFINTFGRAPQLDDHLFYVDQDPDPTQSDGRRCITPIGDSPIQWNNPRAYFDGDVIVKGTLSADRLVAQSITGNEIDSQTTIIAGSGSTTAGMNGYDLATLPDWLGGGSNPYAGYRFWAGSTTPEFANFTVDDNGRMKAVDGTFSGTITMVGTNGLKVESSTPFGPDNLLEWRGSATGKLDVNGDVILSTLTKLNATTYYSDNNEAYFGGSIIAGTLVTSKATSDLSQNIEVSTGSFGSNGGQIVVLCSLTAGYSELSAGECPSSPTAPSALVRLYDISNGSETLVKSETIQGSYSCSQEGAEHVVAWDIGGSFSFFDNRLVSENRNYKVTALVSRPTFPDSQRLSIISQEA